MLDLPAPSSLGYSYDCHVIKFDSLTQLSREPQLVPLALPPPFPRFFKAIRVGMMIDLFNVCVVQKPSFAPIGGRSIFCRGLGVLPNMTSTFNAAFEYPAHIISSFEYKYLRILRTLGSFSSMLSKKCLSCSSLALHSHRSGFLSLVPSACLTTFVLQPFFKVKLNCK